MWKFSSIENFNDEASSEIINNPKKQPRSQEFSSYHPSSLAGAVTWENAARKHRICELQILRLREAFSFAVLASFQLFKTFWGLRSFQIRYAAHF